MAQTTGSRTGRTHRTDAGFLPNLCAPCSRCLMKLTEPFSGLLPMPVGSQFAAPYRGV